MLLQPLNPKIVTHVTWIFCYSLLMDMAHCGTVKQYEKTQKIGFEL